MTLVQLRYLVAIVDAGLSITMAARQLGATQPGLSKQLKQIEEELGLQLFQRRGKSLDHLTSAGVAVVERARIILAETANIRTLAANHRQTALGKLRIATTHTQASFVLPRALATLKARFPDLRLDLTPVAEDEALRRVEQDAADIVFVSGPDRPDTADLAIPIYRWDLAALARRDDPLAALPGPLSLADLSERPLVTYDSALRPGSSFARAFLEAGLTPRIACSARESDLIRTYVRAQMGLGLLAEMAAEEDAELQVFNIDGLFPPRITWAVAPRDRVLREPVLELLATVAPHIQRQALRRAFDEGREAERNWPVPPHWRVLSALPVSPLGRFPAPDRPALLAG